MGKPFPILASSLREAQPYVAKGSAHFHVVHVPWEMLVPHMRQAMVNHDQTLERLAERGGLSACEAVAVLKDRPWHAMNPNDANFELLCMVQGWYTRKARQRYDG